MPNVASNSRSEQPKPDHRPAVARACLVAGGGFATTIATILGVAGRWRLGDVAVVWALAVLCVVVASTMFLVAYLMRPGS